MSNKYCTAISRDEFINLYKYGNININTSFIILNSDDIENEILELLNYMPFSQDEDYLILKFEDYNCYMSDNFETVKTIFNLKIRKIHSIYTLSRRAQQFYTTKFDPRINFQVLPYTNILDKVHQNSEYTDIDNGIEILFEQFGITNRKEIELKLDSNLKEDFLKIDNYLAADYKNIYLELLFYKRENKFAKEDVGYIFDLIIITLLKERNDGVINKFQQGELKLNTSYTYNKLQDYKKSTLYEYINYIKESDDEKIKKFIEKIDISTIIIGSIFLKIKYLLLNKNKRYEREITEIIESFKPLYLKEVSISLYLIGFVFGYKNLYDDYYSFINLDIFNQEDTERKTTLKVDKIIKEKTLDTKDSTLNYKFTDNEVKSLSLAKLKEMAREIGHTKGLSKFKGNDKDKMKLYKEIKNHQNLLICD